MSVRWSTRTAARFRWAALAAAFALTAAGLPAATGLPAAAASGAAPATSADGRVVFSSDRTGDVELYAVNGDGSALKRLTTSAGDDETRSSPDDPSEAGRTQPAGGMLTLARKRLSGS